MGQNYDLLIFISTYDYYKAYFIQICTNKNRNQIYIIKNDLMENEQQNKDSIEKFIDTYISEIKLVFLYFMETPIHNKKADAFYGAEYCIPNKSLI
jgi:hypothetical protein